MNTALIKIKDTIICCRILFLFPCCLTTGDEIKWSTLFCATLHIRFDKHPIGCEAQQCIHAHFSSAADFDLKVGQTDLIFGVRSGFISRSAHARIQVFVFFGYDLFHPG